MKRMGQVIRVKPEMLDEYKRIHVKIWSEIENAIRGAGIVNYSIFHKDGFLFAYFEYDGPEEEFEQRMAWVGTTPRMQEWWGLTKGMQEPLDTRADGEWWADMEEVFHQD